MARGPTFKIDATLNIGPVVDKAALSKAMADVNALIDRMGIKGMARKQGDVGQVFFGRGVSSAQKGAVTRQLNQSLKDYHESLKNINKEEENFQAKSKRGLFQIMAYAAGWQFAYRTLNFVQQSITETISVYGDLEMALIRIRQASGEATYPMQAFSEQAFAVARETGTNVVEIAQAAKIWAQQGKSVAQSLELTRLAAMGVNLTGQDMQTVISNLTGIMNGWKMSADELSYAQDKLAKISDASAVEVRDLEDAYLRVGLTARSVGITFDELAAMVTQVVTKTRRAGGEIGDAFKTIFTRFRRADVREALQTFAEIPTYLTSAGEAVYQNTGQLRDFTEVMLDLSKAWQEMNQVEQGDLMEILTGVRRTEIGEALFKDMEVYLKTMQDRLGAFGYTAKKNAEMMNSWQKQTANLKTAWQQLGIAIADAGLINGLKNIVKFLTDIADAFSYGITHITAYKFALGGLGIGLLGLVSQIKVVKDAIIALNLAIKANPLIAGVAASAMFVNWAVGRRVKAAERRAQEMKEYDERRKAQLMTFTDTYSGMTTEKRDEKRLELLKLMRAEIAKGNREQAWAISERIKKIDELNQKEKDAQKEQKVKEFEEFEKPKMEEELRAVLAMQEAAGTNAIYLKRLELEGWEAINRTQLGSVEHQRLLNELAAEYVREVYSLASAYEEVVASGIDKIWSGEGTIFDIGKDLFGTARKSIAQDITQLFGEQTGIFNIMSSLTKSPIAQAHMMGIKYGSKLIVDSHIAGIRAGLSGQSAAQAAAAAASGNVDSMGTNIPGGPGGGGGGGGVSIASLAAANWNKKTPLGSKLAIQYAHLAGIQNGNATGFSNASGNAVNLIGALGVGHSAMDYKGSAFQTIFGQQPAPGPIGNFMGSLGMYGGRPSAAQAHANARALGLKKQDYNAYLKQQRNQGNLGGLASGVISGASMYTSMKDAGANPWAAGAAGFMTLAGTMALMAPDPTFATKLGAVVLLMGAAILGSVSGQKTKTTTEVKEQTKHVTSRINITNKQLEIVNRNLVALRKSFEGFVMQESYYLRSRSRSGVNIQGEFALGIRRGYQ